MNLVRMILGLYADSQYTEIDESVNNIQISLFRVVIIICKSVIKT